MHEMDNYCVVTLLPVISKVFEMVLLAVYEPVLVSDSLQYGFKHNTGCNDAIFHLSQLLNILTIVATLSLLRL